MKIINLTLILALGIFISCIKLEKGSPNCIKSKIRELKKQSDCKDISVKEYLFQGKTVYVLNEGSCITDGIASVINENCEIIGYLGGFAGFSEVNGEKFSNATFIKTTWTK